jgi:hypothetical protein
MKFVFVLLLFFISLYGDLSFENDKQKHLLASIPFGIAGEVIVHPLEISGAEKVFYGTLIGLVPGLVKELYDKDNSGIFDKYDLAYDTLGSFSGAISAYYFSNWLFEPTQKDVKLSYKMEF